MDLAEYDISPGIRENYPDEWPDWVLHCLTLLNNAEAPAEEAFLNNADDWVYEMAADLIKILTPTLKYNPKKQSGPEFLGATIGHQERLLNGEDSAHAMNISLQKMNEADARIDKFLRENLTDQQYAEALNKGVEHLAPFFDMTDLIPDITEKKEAIFLECIELAKKQPHNERADFFKGYSKAIDMPLFDENGQAIKRQNATPVQTMMVMFWGEVNQMENIPTVYRWLKKIFFKPNLINFDQIRKMCNRKGLSLSTAGQHSKRDKS